MRRLLAVLVVALVPLTAPPVAVATDLPPDTNVRIHDDDLEIGVLLPRVRISWDDAGGTDIRSYDVRVSRTSMVSPRRNGWTRPEHLQRISHHSTRLTVKQGQVVCVMVRARTWSGVVEPWGTRYTCVIRTLDDSKLHRRGGVTVLRDRRFSNGAASVLHIGTTLTLRRIPKGASTAVVSTIHPERRVYWGIPGYSRSIFATGQGRRHFGWASWYTNRAKRPGPVIINADTERSAPVEGLIVVPTWYR